MLRVKRQSGSSSSDDGFVTSERSLYVEASEHLRDFDYFIRVRQLSQPSRHGFIERVANQINSIKMRNVLFIIFADYQHHLFVLIVCVSTVLSWRPLLRLRRGEKIKERKKNVHSSIPLHLPLASTAPLLGGLFQERLQGDGVRAALDLERPHFLSRRRLYVRVGINLAFRPPAALMLDAVLIRDRLSTLKSFSIGFDMTNVVIKSNPEKRIRTSIQYLWLELCTTIRQKVPLN